ncbi:MAG TPA: histidine kinase [Cyclobacteriaceae bacterium]|nr:histidine kinase [Cyclobacteriaceae bacterium]
MNRLFVHNAFFRLGSGLLFGVLVYLLILLIHNTVEDINKIFSNEELYVCIALSYIAFESMRMVIRLLDRRFSDLDFQKRLIAQIAGSLAASLGLISIAISAYYRWAIGFSIGSGELNIFLIIYGIVGLLYSILYFSHFYLQRENKSRIEQETRLREKVEADFASFKSEINPDLLYESLENLILTIHHNAESAEEQIDYLAGIYRYSLIHRHKELVSLEEELMAAGNLVHLLNFKAHHISLVSTLSETHSIHLIPGSLLVTLDSIVRNTLISAHSPLVMNLSLEEDDDYLVLQHTLNDKLISHADSLIAFGRLQRSYSFFAEKPFLQIKAGGENYIKFPLVRIQETFDEPV